MRVLVLSHKPPYPIVDGGCLAMSRFLHDLSEAPEIEHIDYLTFSTHKHPFDSETYKALNFKNVTFAAIDIDTKIKAFPALLCLLKQESYHTKRFLNNQVSELILEQLNSRQYDHVVFESLYAAIYAPIIRPFFTGKIHYRSHNIEHRIWEDLARNQRNPLKKWYLNQLSKSLKKEEVSIWNQIDAIFSISKEDAMIIKESTNKIVHYLPSSIPSKNMSIPWNRNRLCFLGAFDWEPNLEAIKWFISAVFPLLRQQYPTLEFHIAGRKCERIPKELKQDHIKIHGFVEDPLQFIAENGLFVACLQSGSGIKMKVLEAMSIGAPCILTVKAAEGLDLNGMLPIHKDVQTFATDIMELLRDTDLQKQRGASGKLFISSEFSSEVVQKVLQKELSLQQSIERQSVNNV
jgi:glycosyltransferase involved in cell wall biosynthesis